MTLFTLNRDRYRDHLRDEYGEDVLGIDCAGEHGLAREIANALDDASNAQAIYGPYGLDGSGVEVLAYGLDDHDTVLVAIREKHPDLSQPLRQVASYSIESKRLIDLEQDVGFEGRCAVVEELLALASRLLPSLDAMIGAPTLLYRAEPEHGEIRDFASQQDANEYLRSRGGHARELIVEPARAGYRKRALAALAAVVHADHPQAVRLVLTTGQWDTGEYLLADYAEDEHGNRLHVDEDPCNEILWKLSTPQGNAPGLIVDLADAEFRGRDIEGD